MKGYSSALFSIIIFLSIISLFLSGILTQANTLNQPVFNKQNLTILQGASAISNIPQAPICNIYPDIVGVIIDGIGCGVNYVIWITQLATVSSDYQWLAIIITACIAILALIAIKVISGFIPTAGGVH